MAIGLSSFAVISFVAACGVIYHAAATREQFYPAMLYLASSKLSLLVLSNLALLVLFLCARCIKTVFLGRLREAEVERLYELGRHELMETCLALTIFRDQFDSTLLFMFLALISVKLFHCLAHKRLEYVETTPALRFLAHARLLLFLFLLLTVDFACLNYAASRTLHHLRHGNRPTSLLLFSFEYTLLASGLVAALMKYALHAVDLYLDSQWELKPVCIFYLDLARDLVHLVLYTTFFITIFNYYGLPLHLVRDLYDTFRTFKQRVADFLRYRRITSNMNDRFVDATPEELNSGDATCIICREEMTAAKKLSCGHLFHIHCLRSWLERQQTCPTCRAPVLPPTPPQANPPPQNGAHPPGGHIHQPAPPPRQPGVAGAQPPQNGEPRRVQYAVQFAIPLGGRQGPQMGGQNRNQNQQPGGVAWQYPGAWPAAQMPAVGVAPPQISREALAAAVGVQLQFQALAASAALASLASTGPWGVLSAAGQGQTAEGRAAEIAALRSHAQLVQARLDELTRQGLSAEAQATAETSQQTEQGAPGEGGMSAGADEGAQPKAETRETQTVPT